MLCVDWITIRFHLSHDQVIDHLGLVQEVFDLLYLTCNWNFNILIKNSKFNWQVYFFYLDNLPDRYIIFI